jgi:hypothetical protein
MSGLRVLALTLCILTADAFVVQSPALPLTRLSRSAPAFSAPFMMVDEPASKVSDPTPSPAPAEQKGFDWTQYSLTIAIATVFLIVKTLSYLGIYNPSGLSN